MIMHCQFFGVVFVLPAPCCVKPRLFKVQLIALIIKGGLQQLTFEVSHWSNLEVTLASVKASVRSTSDDWDTRIMI